MPSLPSTSPPNAQILRLPQCPGMRRRASSCSLEERLPPLKRFTINTILFFLKLFWVFFDSRNHGRTRTTTRGPWPQFGPQRTAAVNLNQEWKAKGLSRAVFARSDSELAHKFSFSIVGRLDNGSRSIETGIFPRNRAD